MFVEKIMRWYIIPCHRLYKDLIIQYKIKYYSFYKPWAAMNIDCDL